MKKLFIMLSVMLISVAILYSCKKDAGEGGTSSIYGKVKVRDYDPTFTILQDVYYAQDQKVFIIYGDDKGIDDDVRTSYDGTYEFKYLRPGTYHIFVYSKDSTLQSLADIAIIKTVEITKNHQDVEVPEIVILN
jgi:hypothetical protein